MVDIETRSITNKALPSSGRLLLSSHRPKYIRTGRLRSLPLSSLIEAHIVAARRAVVGRVDADRTKSSYSLRQLIDQDGTIC